MADHAIDNDWLQQIMAADHAVEGFFDGDIFIYRGGRAPLHVTHVLIDESVDDVEDNAFDGCECLLTVDTHNSLRKVGKMAFSGCRSLRQINLKSVVEIDQRAFYGCENLEFVEFGDYLKTIGKSAFSYCFSLKHLKLPSIIAIGLAAFWNCKRLKDVELSGRLQTIGKSAFWECERLQRIALPLKRDLFEYHDSLQRYSQFDRCDQLTTVDLVGGTQRTVASLHMESWRTDMNGSINRINQVLPSTLANEKTGEIKSIIDHYVHVKEGITLLELALWKAKLDEKENNSEELRTKKADVDAEIECARNEKRITCGADIVIKNLLPFLRLAEDNPRVKAPHGEPDEGELNDHTHGGGRPPFLELELFDIQLNVMNEILNDERWGFRA